MILDKEIEIGLGSKNIDYFESLGYKIPRYKDNRGRILCKKGTKIKVLVKDLMKSSKVKVLIKCDKCGKERKVHYDMLCYRENSQYLITGKTLCVSCSNKELFSGDKSPNYKHGNSRYSEYRYNAQKRDINFNLTIEEFEKLTNEECHYCGGNSKDINEKSRGNGIDRKDSSKDYIIDNCVPCCATCNFIKNKMPYGKFIEYIRRVYIKTKDYEI